MLIVYDIILEVGEKIIVFANMVGRHHRMDDSDTKHITCLLSPIAIENELVILHLKKDRAGRSRFNHILTPFLQRHQEMLRLKRVDWTMGITPHDLPELDEHNVNKPIVRTISRYTHL